MARIAALGSAIREQRTLVKMTQRALAEKVRVTQPFIAQIEKGSRTNLSAKLLFEISEALGVKPDYFHGAVMATPVPAGWDWTAWRTAWEIKCAQAATGDVRFFPREGSRPTAAVIAARCKFDEREIERALATLDAIEWETVPWGNHLRRLTDRSVMNHLTLPGQ